MWVKISSVCLGQLLLLNAKCIFSYLRVSNYEQCDIAVMYLCLQLMCLQILVVFFRHSGVFVT